jgi:tRNA modification GTPase
MTEHEESRPIETVVAIATPPGEGAIGIVRLSGPGVRAITNRIFQGRRGGAGKSMTPYRLTLGRLHDPDSGRAVDEVMTVFMPGPQSYTGEDMVEFQAHGGRAVLAGIVDASLAAGARPAAPGEFTRRAFLNGRLDLAQAEAVIDLILSRSRSSREAALEQLEGRLSAAIGALRDSLGDMAAVVEATIEFGEEEGLEESVSPDPIEKAIGTVRDLLAGEGEGRVLRDGLQVTFSGRTNVGKSSIINMLSDSSRSIVTPFPGTTRDTVESPLNLEGLSALLVDTAGFGPPRDAVEEEGIRRSRERLTTADLAVIVLDSSEPLDESDRDLLDSSRFRPSLVVLNKSDLPGLVDTAEIRRLARERPIVETSAKTGAGLEELRRALGRAVRSLFPAPDGEHPILTSSRHADVLRRALAGLERAKENLEKKDPIDMLASDIREALSCLGEITGETVTEEVLDRIFSNFCVGK